MHPVIVVLDIGKSNIKVSAVSIERGQCIAVKKRENKPVYGYPYQHADIDAIWTWFCEQLAEMGKQFYVRYITCTTHGATAVCLSQEQVALPVLDYEYDLDSNTNTKYAEIRPPYSETRSPNLSVGLNIGRQLFWLSRQFPAEFKNVDTILTFLQYWCWKLSGVACSEVTSLGCHTDLWNPESSTLSSLVKGLDWESLFPPMLNAGESLGKILPVLSKTLGLPVECEILNGLHDSNASLVPYLLRCERPFTVMSTGTWVVIANVGGATGSLSEDQDMLCNVDAFGEPVPCIRFMGGREWEILHAANTADLSDLKQVLDKGVYLLPSFSSQGGPFRHHNGKIIGESDSLNAREKTALATIYCALVSDYCLTRLGCSGPIHIEGSFSNNPLFAELLSVFRQHQSIYTSSDQTGTTLGTASLLSEIAKLNMLSLNTFSSSETLPVEQLSAYRKAWFEMIKSLI